MRKFRFYKEGESWYVDLPEWEGSKADLQMVAGADDMLNYMAEGNSEVDIYLSVEPFEGSDKLNFKELAGDIGSGAYYIMPIYRGIELNLEMWLCDVTLFVFKGEFPKTIYISST